MLKGIYLTLLIGPVIPVVAPKVVMEALTGIEVTNGKDRGGFQINFSLAKNSPLLTTMLPAGYFDPISTRVIIIATLNGFPQVLMDGMVTNQQINPSTEPGKSTLSITGEDMSIMMDLIEIRKPFPGIPKYAQILTVLAPYAALGVIPLVIPPMISTVKSITTGHDTQVTTDRSYLKSVAQQVGYIFSVQPGLLPGQNIAYFGPDVNLPIPQPALTINMDAHTNVEALNFSLDGLVKKVRIYTIYDPITKKIPLPVPVPNINLFKPPLGIKPIPPSKVSFEDETAKMDFPDAMQKVFSDLLNADNSASVSGSGSLNVLRYNRILRARMLVGVRGAGIAYDGMYYVDTVTHSIKPGEYKQNFTLSRDGLISNTPKLLV